MILETIRRLSQGRLILLSIVIIIVILIVIYFEVLSWSIPRVSTTSRCLSRAEIRQIYEMKLKVFSKVQNIFIKSMESKKRHLRQDAKSIHEGVK